MSLIDYVGIKDKIISTRGYCFVVMDEGTGLFDDLKKKKASMNQI